MKRGHIECALGALLGQAPEIILLLDQEGVILYANRAFNGLTTDDLVGSSLHAYLPSGPGGGRLRTALRQAADTGRPVRFDPRIVSPSGQATVWSGRMAPVCHPGKPTRYWFFARDFSEADAPHEAFLDQAQFLNAILDNSPLVFCAKDVDGCLLWANRVFEELVGQPRGKVLGKTFLELFDTRGLDAVAAREQQVFAEGKPAVVEEVIHLADGPHTFLASKLPLNMSGLPQPVLCSIALDITAWRRDEEALRRSEREVTIRNRIANIFLTVPDDEVYSEVLDVILAALESEYGFFGYLDNGDLVSPSLTKNVWDKCKVSDKTYRFPLGKWGDTIWGRAIKEKGTLCSNTPLDVPEGHVPVLRVLSTTLVHQGKAVGNITVANKQTPYTDADQRLLEDVAGSIAPILHARRQQAKHEQQREKAEEALRGARDELERRVEERTTELLQANRVLQEEVAERKRVEKALRASETSLAKAQQIAHLGNWHWDIGEDRFYFSEEALRIFGRSPLEPGFSKKGFLDVVHPEDRAAVEAALQKAIRNEGTYDIDYRILLPNGDMRVVHEQAEVSFDEHGKALSMLGITMDITERRRAEEALHESEERYRTVVEFAADFVYWQAPDGGICYLSPSCVEFTGYAPEEISASPALLDAMVHEEDRKLWRKHSHSASRCGPPQPIEYRIVRKDGQLRWVSHACRPVYDDNGAYLGVRCSNRDITEQKRAEEEARQRRQQLVQADKMVSLGTLVSGVAHEINNPNHAIMGNASLLLETWTSIRPILDRFYEDYGDFVVGGYEYSVCRDEIPGMIAGIVESARRIQLIVQELRAFSRQSPPDELGMVDVNAVMKSANLLMSNMIDKATTCFTVTCGAELPKVKGNFQRLEQVVINLVQNACQALPERDRGIWVATAPAARGRAVTIEVRDEGIGIPAADLSRIVDPFFTTKRGAGGSGLGLWISSNIVNEHGGTLEFTSEPGKGTRALVTLPVNGPNGAWGQRREERAAET